VDPEPVLTLPFEPDFPRILTRGLQLELAVSLARGRDDLMIESDGYPNLPRDQNGQVEFKLKFGQGALNATSNLDRVDGIRLRSGRGAGTTGGRGNRTGDAGPANDQIGIRELLPEFREIGGIVENDDLLGPIAA